MRPVKLFSLALLAFVAIAPNVLSSMAFGPLNAAYAIAIVGLMIFLSISSRRIAKLAVIPLAAIITLPPYPYWVYMDNSGTYSFVFNRAGIEDSVGFISVLFAAYAVIFSLVYFLGKKTVVRLKGTEAIKPD